MSTFSPEPLGEMERLFAAAKADNAQLAVKVVELEAQKAQLVLEVEALKAGYELTRKHEVIAQNELIRAHAENNRLRAELVEGKQQTYSSRADIAEVRLRACQAQLTELREAATGVCESAALVANECAEVSSEQIARLQAVLEKVKP